MSYPTAKLYTVCIGVNRCPFSKRLESKSLDYAEKDADELYKLLLQMGFEQENSSLLIGENATLRAINDALRKWIVNTPQRNDVVLAYFAGHGLPLLGKDQEEDPDAYSDVFLAPYDFDEQRIREDRGFREDEALGMERLRNSFFTRTRSNKVLFIFDSCYSGDFFGPQYRSDVADAVQGHIQRVFAQKTVGARIALASCLPGQQARESKQYGHGLFTYYLLEALRGNAREALDESGWVTVGRLVEYISEKLPDGQKPVRAGVEQAVFKLIHYPDKVKNGAAIILTQQELEQKQEQEFQRHQAEKVARLKAMLADDHRGFFQDRLSSFVGREHEQAEVRQRISGMLLTGGYITITGQAGQGKSSIIAKLITEYGPEQVAFHFIPFRPGPDHQVGLLRNLMARLILKYDLSDLYVESESRAALRGYFPKVLEELVVKGGQEVIFIDGLDQLQEEQNGRDLSFLPDNPPRGVVFVLGTRPNDTLRPLQVLKPHYEYELPNLSRGDFDLILQHRGVHLSRELADRFYEVMQENALYLDLVAKELAETELKNPVEVIERVADDPNNIFTLSIDRLRIHERQWRRVLKPILGLLLAASEPLSIDTIRYILRVDYDEIRNGLQKLGGLVAEDGQGRRYLYHLRFRDYLCQDRDKPYKEYVFASNEEEGWHKRLVVWCEQGGIEQIWSDVLDGKQEEQERREYARKHYITHLYRARKWQRLWEVLDQGNYGRSKVRYGLGMRSYTQDLDLGRQAVAQEGGNIRERDRFAAKGMVLYPLARQPH
jgi:hypothetical protein